MVKTKEGQIIRTEDFVGDVVFHQENDDDFEYREYIESLK